MAAPRVSIPGILSSHTLNCHYPQHDRKRTATTLPSILWSYEVGLHANEMCERVSSRMACMHVDSCGSVCGTQPYQCGGSIEHDESDFFAIPDDFTEYIDRLCHICQVACPKCEGIVCLACNEPRVPVPLPSELKDYTRAPEVLLHCANLQAVIIGVGLHLAGKLCTFDSGLAATYRAN